MNAGRAVGESGEGRLLPGAAPQRLPRQIVTLAYPSAQLPAAFISEELARRLAAETGASVVLVHLKPRDGDGMDEPAESSTYLNGEFHLPPHLAGTDGGFHALTLGVGREPPSPAGLDSLVEQLSVHFRFVLVETLVDERPAAWLFELLKRSDLAYLFLKGTAGDIYHLDVVMREARTRCPDVAHIKPIGCLAEGERLDGFDLLAQRVASPLHLFLRGCPMGTAAERATAVQTHRAGSFASDVRRIAREIGGCLVGLALSSGAAKGFAHIGVIQVLEENGIEVDVVAGASMGAYVGALWAHGNDGRELERLARELEGRWTLWSLVDPVFPPRQGFLRGYAVKRRLMRSIGRARFGELVRPLRLVATNLATLERVVFSSGEVATAVHASIAVPGICVPITLEDGETYIDGGIADPLPVDVLREMGVARVIAVDVIPTPDRIRYGLEAERELGRLNGWGRRSFWSRLLRIDRRLNYFSRGNLFEILMRSVHGAQIRVAEASCRLADVVLRPDICDDRWLDYRHPGKFIALGREAAERHLEEIKSLVARKDNGHERQPVTEPVAGII